MSSRQTTSMFRSSVFRLVLLSSTGFVVAAILTGWVLGRLALSSEREKDRQAIQDVVTEITEQYQQSGLASVREDYSGDEGPFWERDHLHFMYEEDEMLVQVSTRQKGPIFGYRDVEAPLGWSVQKLDDPDFERPLVLFAVESERGHKLTVGKFRSEGFFGIKELQSVSMFFLLIIVLPLSLITAYYVSRKVFRRLQQFSDVAEQVGAGDLTSRLQLRGNKDEFDRLANNINDMLDNVQALQRNIEGVSVGIAHDLKTPVTHLHGRLELISQDIANPEAVAEHVDVAKRNVNRILHTFNALLRLGEIEAGKRQRTFSELDLSALVLDIAESYEPVFEDANKRLDTSVIPDVRIMGDADLLVQMIINLLENIVEHSDDHAQAWIRLQHSREGAVLQIGDNGPGIEAQHHERIFERFYKVDQSRTSAGNGLGLSLVKSICDLHQAEINLLTKQKGTVFDIYISVNMLLD